LIAYAEITNSKTKYFIIQYVIIKKIVDCLYKDY